MIIKVPFTPIGKKNKVDGAVRDRKNFSGDGDR